MPRTYNSPRRDEASAATRQRLLDAASTLLREGLPLSLEAVGKAVGVTRLTVYNQFGSRRGLLEAAFDARAEAGGLHRIAEAMAMPDPLEALGGLVDIFCDFWLSDPALARLHSLASEDPELAEAINARNERRRRVLDVLVRRMPEVGVAARAGLADSLFALTSQPVVGAFSQGKSVEQAAALLRELALQIVRSARSPATEG